MGEKASYAQRLAALRLYCITSPPRAGQAYEELVEAMCRGGADAVQLRVKEMPLAGWFDLARRLRKICAGHGVLFIVNDRPDAAAAAEADGVHLGQDDGSIAGARKMMGPGRIVGRSTHSAAQACAAEAEGADYIGIGPLFETPTKPGRPAIGLGTLRETLAAVHVPAVAIGGIDASNVDQVLSAGARRIAVVRAICASPDAAQAARFFKERLTSANV